jgi:hypothetical protein
MYRDAGKYPGWYSSIRHRAAWKSPVCCAAPKEACSLTVRAASMGTLRDPT